MGRTEPTVTIQPQQFRRDQRAKQAKATIHKTIPALLKAHPRASKGIDAAELISDPAPIKAKAQKDGKAAKQHGDASTAQTGLKIRVWNQDVLTAAHRLSDSGDSSAGATDKGKHAAQPNVTVLNMASPLRPGGGFLNGATSQEEFLCMRTTLYPSLKDEWYRIPEYGGIWSPDVLVFRSSGKETRRSQGHDDEKVEEKDDAFAEWKELPKKERWWVDVVSAGMVKFAEVQVDEEDVDGAGWQKYRELLLRKMSAVLRICAAKGAKKVVLGAWGCGVFGNPPSEVASAWRKALLGNEKKRKGVVDGLGSIEEVVFAVTDPAMANLFRAVFEDVLEEEAEEEELNTKPSDSIQNENQLELEEKIRETEQQIEQTKVDARKAFLQAHLATLKKQLADMTDPEQVERRLEAAIPGNSEDEDDTDDDDDETASRSRSEGDELDSEDEEAYKEVEGMRAQKRP